MAPWAVSSHLEVMAIEAAHPAFARLAPVVEAEARLKMNARTVEDFMLPRFDFHAGEGINGAEKTFGDGFLVFRADFEAKVHMLRAENCLVVFRIGAVDDALTAVFPGELVPVEGDEEGVIVVAVPLKAPENRTFLVR